MAISAWNNVRDCMINKPPLVVFSASIAAFALTLVAVSLYIETHKAHLLNPDVKDWNTFYKSMSEMIVCLPTKSKTSGQVQRISRDLAAEVLLDPMFNKTTPESNITSTISADLKLVVNGKEVHDMTLHGTIKAEDLGFRRDYSMLDVKIHIPTKGDNACLYLSGPSHLLPDASVTPSSCKMPQDKKQANVLFENEGTVARDWCSTNKIGKISVLSDPNLDIYLSEGDTTLMQLHIMYTTSLLCVMMVGLLFYAMCGRRCSNRSKMSIVQDKVPLQP